jgi:UDPglucose 6-dehydrogenase
MSLNKKNIVVVGLGYVGVANSILLAQKNDVLVVDLDEKKINLINKKISPIEDEEATKYLQSKSLNILARKVGSNLYKDSDYVIIATPTNYDDYSNNFDTKTVQNVIANVLDETSSATIIIKSTVPVGFTELMRKKFNTKKIIFSPEFLREGKALYDNLYPTRIVVGDTNRVAKNFAKLLSDAALKKDIPKLLISSTEAEATKLFANSYLAMRVAFFNELDSFALKQNLNPRSIINSLGLDPRIGDYYNNPSFGYGGYCLPKDTRQLLANYTDIPQNIIQAIVDSNKTRKDFICDEILKLRPNVVGVNRLIMKQGSDNIRHSSMVGIVKRLKEKGIKLIIYEPLIKENVFIGSKVIKNFNSFINNCDLILTNRMSKDLEGLEKVIFTRDLYQSD